MDYSLLIGAVLTFVESRVRERINYTELEKATGFSYRHIRETFYEITGKTLGAYITERKVSCAAFDIKRSEMKMSDIALRYGYTDYTTFARAFKRVAGVSPRSYRYEGRGTVIRKIYPGIFAPVIDRGPYISDMGSQGSGNEAILYGVPKVSFRLEEQTPFCGSLKALLIYNGQEADYPRIMAASGAAFRLRWNADRWDPSNVDIMNIYPDRFRAMRLAAASMGCELEILLREDSDKAGFMDIIRRQIDAGHPLIALGIIGPPEACVITGYRDGGLKLLGWNYFQEQSEVSAGVGIDSSGYFISSDWWENENTIALISVILSNNLATDDAEIISNALTLLTQQTIEIKRPGNSETYACGQQAYRRWLESIRDDSQFGKGMLVPLLVERMMCQIDGETVLLESRCCAALYLQGLALRCPQVIAQCKRASALFMRIYRTARRIGEGRDSSFQIREQLENFRRPATRQEMSHKIERAMKLEAQTIPLLREIAAILERLRQEE